MLYMLRPCSEYYVHAFGIPAGQYYAPQIQCVYMGRINITTKRQNTFFYRLVWPMVLVGVIHFIVIASQYNL